MRRFHFLPFLLGALISSGAVALVNSEARADISGRCSRILRPMIDPISSLIDLARRPFLKREFRFNHGLYEKSLSSGPSARTPPRTLEELMGGIDAILAEERYHFSLVRLLNDGDRLERSRILSDLREILNVESRTINGIDMKTVSDGAISRLSKGVYAIQNGLPYHSYQAISRFPGRAIDEIALGRMERFLTASTFASAVRMMGYQTDDAAPYVVGRMWGYIRWALAIPAKALGFGEQEIRVLRMKVSEEPYRTILATDGYDAAMRKLFKDSGKKIRNEARFNYALSLAGAGFSLYGTWSLVEWITHCDDGKSLPLGVLPDKACGEAKEIPVEEIRARLLTRWKKDQEAMGEVIAPDDIDYQAQIQNYLSMSETDLRRMWTKIESSEH